MLYLHESIDIVGSGQDAYIEAVMRRAAHSEASGISRLFGCWRVVGSTGRWPRVVNLWEMDDWAHWAEGLERQFVPERQDSHLAPWWQATAQWRRGGFDRILEAAPPSLRRDELVQMGRRFWVCEQTTLRARPGRAEGLVAAAMETLPALLARHDVTIIGTYTAALRAGEVIVLAGAPRFADLCAWYARRDDDPSWCRWRARQDDLAETAATVWLAPAPGTPLYPLDPPSDGTA